MNALSKYAKYEKLYETQIGRKELTRSDPLLFALLYLPQHLKSNDGDITFSEFHFALIEYAKSWQLPLGKMKEYRDAFVAPRETGKSTWLFLILPLWAAAHNHVKFVAAFSDSATQAEQHLQTFKRELDTNHLLKKDYPELCAPAKRTNVARQLADNRGQIHQANDFVFMARGVDSAVAGMKVGSRRPEVIILDDIEPGESNYSIHLMSKRLNTVQDVIMPLNAFARVILVGTTTMPGSIIHQMVQAAKGNNPSQWIEDENVNPHYFPAILSNEDGTERSLWPDKWPLEELQDMRNTRSFLKNFMNDPVDIDGTYWKPEDIKLSKLEDYGHTILSIDPAVTSNASSDWTGISIISKHPSEAKLYVRYANHVKLAPQELRAHVLSLINRFDDIGLILVETNQGGDLWHSILGGTGIKIKTIHQKLKKEIRAQKALVHYERSRVFHTEHFPVLEDELFSFPNSLHDDCLDAVTTGIGYFTEKKSAPSKVLNYVG